MMMNGNILRPVGTLRLFIDGLELKYVSGKDTEAGRAEQG